MDFGELLYAAQRNEHNTKKESATKCYKTKFEPPKKEQKSQKNLSTNIQKFLARKEEEEKQRQEEANRKREELLSLRAQDGKAKKRVAAMLKRTKAANKAAIADAVDNDNTAVTISGLAAQPDEDDYGYVSQEAAAFYDKLLMKYHSTPAEQPLYSKRSQPKSDAKDLLNTKDRVRMALLRQEEEEMMPHKRKRKTKEEKLKERGEDQVAEEQDTYNEPEPPPVEKPSKPKRPAAPPPLDFHQLLKIAEKKQFEPIKLEPKVKQDDDERPMTKKQRAEYLKEQEWRMRKEGKLPPLSSGSQESSSRSSNNRPQAASRPPADQGFKRPADPPKAARPAVDRDNHAPNRSQQSGDRPRPGNTTAMKSRPQNANTERSRPSDDDYKERNHVENDYKDRNRTPSNGYGDRNQAMMEKARLQETNRHRSAEDAHRERARPSEDAYRERARPSEDTYRERARPSEDTYRERGRPSEDTHRERRRPSEDTYRERARPSEDTSREKKQSEVNYKDKYRSSEKSQFAGKPREKSQSTEMQRGSSGSERREHSSGSGQASIPRVPKVSNSQKEEQNSSSSFNGSNKLKKLQGNADGKVGKERNMLDLFGDDNVPVIKSNKNIPQSASDQKKPVISANMKSDYGKKFQESLKAKLEERERARNIARVQKPDVGPSPAKISKLQSDDNRGPKLQPRPVKGDMPRKEVSNAKPAVRPPTVPRPGGGPPSRPGGAPASRPGGGPPSRPGGGPPSRLGGGPPSRPAGGPPSRPAGAPPSRPPGAPPSRPTGAPPSRPQDGTSKPRVSSEMASRASKPPMSSRDVKPKQFPPADVQSRQFPPSDVRPKQFPPSDIRPRQFPPPDVRRKQFPPGDMRRRPKPPMKRRIEDSDEDYDSELDDFIDDGPQEDDMDYSRHIKEIFGYDKSRYADVDDDDECMESSFSQQLKEEFVSTKLGIMEDLEDMRQEKEMEKRKKMKKMMMMKKKK